MIYKITQTWNFYCTGIPETRRIIVVLFDANKLMIFFSYKLAENLL